MFNNLINKFKKINIPEIDLKKVDFKKIGKAKTHKKSGELSSTNKILYDIYFNHYRNLPEYEDASDEIINSLVDIDNIFLLLNSKALHLDYLTKINDFYKKEIISDDEMLDAEYSLQDFKNLEIGFSAKTRSEMPEKLRNNKNMLKEKYEICKKEMMIPLIRLSDNKKILGIIKPTIHMSKIRHHDVVFLTSDLVSQFYMIKGLEFLENNISTNESTNEETSPNDLLNSMLQFMIDKGYSDLELYLHDTQNYGIKARKNGSLRTIAKKVSMITAKKITEALLRRIEEDVKTTKSNIAKKLTFQTTATTRNFRVEMIAQSKTGIHGLHIHRAIDIRLLGDNSFIKDFSNLGYGERVEKIIKDGITSSKTGFYLIAGATNSGKSTTLFSILYFLQSYLEQIGEDKKIKTIENPLEYDIDGFISVDLQDTAGTDRALTIPQIIASFLRGDPDIISLSEMRYKEDFEAFFQVGLRGHPTFGTLHTNSVKETITFLEEQCNANVHQLRGNLKLLMHTDLVKRICKCCKGKGYLNDDKEELCLECDGEGEKGKIPIFELVFFNQKEDGEFGFDSRVDDIFDFEKLVSEGKILWVKKKDVATHLYEQGEISESDYELYTGLKKRKVIELAQQGIN